MNVQFAVVFVIKLYAPTTLAPARDFWLLRYTSVLEDGSLVVCERSLNNTQNGPSIPQAPHFVRAEMLPSGYLIRPCEGGGSIIHIVDHLDLEVLIFDILFCLIVIVWLYIWTRILT